MKPSPCVCHILMVGIGVVLNKVGPNDQICAPVVRLFSVHHGNVGIQMNDTNITMAKLMYKKTTKEDGMSTYLTHVAT